MCKVRSIRALLAGITFLTGALPGWSQQVTPNPAGGAHRIAVGTEVVRVPAIVTDRSGGHIPDLKAEEFTIFENGKVQKIAFFEHVWTKPELLKPRAPSENEVTNTYEKSAGRLTIILLDMLNTSFPDQERARRSITKFLGQTLVATEPVALMTLDADGIRVVHDFTMDPGVLAVALKKVTAERSTNEINQPVQLDPIFGRRSPIQEANLLRRLEIEGQTKNFHAVGGVRLTLTSLREIGEAFAGIPGRKSLIWATGGLAFPADDKAVMKMWTGSLSTMYEDTWLALNRADVAVYPLDVEGLVNWYYRNPAYEAQMFTRRLYEVPYLQTSVYDMENFAHMTGGSMCYVKTEIEGCFRKASADSSDYYLLGFYPEPDPKRTGWRKLAVQVSRQDAKVQARTSYFVGTARGADSGREADLQLGLASPLDYTDLPLTVRYTDRSEKGGKKMVGFQFRLAQGVVTVDEADGNHVDMDFAAVAISAKSKIEAQFSKQVEGRTGAAQAKALKAGAAFLPGEMELAPGEYMVRFVVRDNLSGRMGSISTPLKVE
jgi:VWFA-related protein